MELAESAYLYALAQISITFAGFTALIMLLRQNVGGKTSAMDFFVTRNFLLISFLIVAGTMVPSLLAALSLPHDLVWRAASAAVAVPLLAFVASLPWRRRAVTTGRSPKFVWVRESIHVAAIVILLLNAAGLLGIPKAGPFELGLFLILFGQLFAFVMSTDQLLIAHHWSKTE